MAVVLIGGLQADVSLEDAIKIGKKNFKELVDQSYHYKVEYDQVIALPVHSRTIWKNDFYLLYFLKDDIFQAEMEVDKETGKAAILSVGLMSPPYHELLEGTFCHKYFSADSIKDLSERRFRAPTDSVRLVYFGVIPRLGKRGVLWEIYSAAGKSYINVDGPTLTMEQIVRDLNTHQRQAGNYTVDSIRLVELVAEISRLITMTGTEREYFGLTSEKIDSLTSSREQEMEEIYNKFTDLRGKVSLPKDLKK
jgi:hypothetical protein